MAAHWREGLGQEILHLMQCYQHSRTQFGLFGLRTYFSRLVADEQIINVEAPVAVIRHLAAKSNNEDAKSLVLTVEELLNSSDLLAPKTPYNLVDGENQLVPGELARLCRFLAHPLRQLREHPLDAIDSKLPDLTCGIPGAMSSPLPSSSVLPLEQLLELSFRAHPDRYPRWWVDAKKRLIAAGRPQEAVPVSARPRRDRNGGGDTGTVRCQRASDDDHIDHTRRWLQQQTSEHAPPSPPRPARPAALGSTGSPIVRDLPAHSPLPTPEPTTKTHAPLYHASEIRRTSSVRLQDDTRLPDDIGVDSESGSDDESSLDQGLAQFTLAGWRVRLVSPEAMSARWETS